ncbi:UNVERIFIED_CONTAM: hypothetical protein Sindi_2418800 [Sesamum indicum]
MMVIMFGQQGWRLIWRQRIFEKLWKRTMNVPPLPANPIMAQIKNHKERKSKARTSLFVVVSSEIFRRIMTMKLAFEIWNFLKKEYEGDERIKGMKILNLIREFELQKMKMS